MTEIHVLKILGYTRFQFLNKLTEHGIQFPSRTSGRKNHLPHLAIIDAVVDYQRRWRCGYKRCAAALVAHAVKCTRQEVEWVCINRNLFQFRVKAIIKRDKRCVAAYVGMVWHTDLHYVDPVPPSTEPRQHLIAFLDDRSRYILYAQLLSDKSMASTSKAFAEALASNPVPQRITSDNGTEFIGRDFQAVALEYGLVHHRIHPRSPWENGKIERWWRTFEKSRLSGNSLQHIVKEHVKYCGTQL
jgi:transposase InsO family protein